MYWRRCSASYFTDVQHATSNSRSLESQYTVAATESVLWQARPFMVARRKARVKTQQDGSAASCALAYLHPRKRSQNPQAACTRSAQLHTLASRVICLCAHAAWRLAKCHRCGFGAPVVAGGGSIIAALHGNSHLHAALPRHFRCVSTCVTCCSVSEDYREYLSGAPV